MRHHLLHLWNPEDAPSLEGPVHSTARALTSQRWKWLSLLGLFTDLFFASKFHVPWNSTLPAPCPKHAYRHLKDKKLIGLRENNRGSHLSSFALDLEIRHKLPLPLP